MSQTLATETRGPVFTPRALEAGAAGMLACQLYVEGDDPGALNLFSRTPGALNEESEHVALMFAAHAAVRTPPHSTGKPPRAPSRPASSSAEPKAFSLNVTRSTAEQAFTMLVRVSQHRNEKLRDIAERLVLCGELEEQQQASAESDRP